MHLNLNHGTPQVEHFQLLHQSRRPSNRQPGLSATPSGNRQQLACHVASAAKKIGENSFATRTPSSMHFPRRARLPLMTQCRVLSFANSQTSTAETKP